MPRFVLPLLFLAACHKDAPAPPVPAVTPSVPEAGAKQLGGSDIVTELQTEAANRPKGTTSVEQVIAAVEGLGTKMTHRQVLASPLKAHYCENGSTAAGLGMSICEFDDAAKAGAGKERSLEIFKKFGKRTLLVNGATLLTVTEPETPSAMAEKDKVLALFPSLSSK